MNGARCSTHADRPANYRCESCERLLCENCVEAGHALLFCCHCRERALPLAGAVRPTGPSDRRRRQAVARPYSLADALTYPFRRSGALMFAATLVSMVVVGWIGRWGIGLMPLALGLGFWSLLVGLQFKIVRQTAEGDDEVPDWPDYLDWGERLPDLLSYMFVSLLQVAPAAIYLLVNRERLLAPSAAFWGGCALLLWLGTAGSTMAFGAAGAHGPGEALRVDRHLRGFLAGGADAVWTVNAVFGIGALVFLLRAALDDVPIAGAAVGGVLGAYWTFVSAHLIGLLFRRRHDALATIYGEVGA